MEIQTSKDTTKAGTGFMMTLTDAMQIYQNRGYTENLKPCSDHFCCHNREIDLYPDDIQIDDILRFENSSDPMDQSILYLISSKTKNVKGLYAESYGLYHEELSDKLRKSLRINRYNS